MNGHYINSSSGPKISEVIWDFDFCLLPDQQQLKNNHREDLVAES